MNAVLKEQPAELPAPVPPALALIVRRCLEKDPVRRFQSAADLGFAFQASSPSLPPAAAPKRRLRLKWAAVAAAIRRGCGCRAFLADTAVASPAYNGDSPAHQ